MVDVASKELAQGRSIDLPIRSVTVMEDRAQIVRQGTVELQAGQTRLVIEDVAPVLVDKTLSARILSGKARVGDLRARRWWKLRQEDRPEGLQELDERIRKEGLALESLRRERALAEAKRERFGELLARSFEDLALDTAAGRGPDETLWKSLDEVYARKEALGLEGIEGERRERELVEGLERLQMQRQVLVDPSSVRGAALEFEILCDQAGPVRFTVEYLVPGACWRPRHEARLRGSHLRFSTEACVWQNTGEDWTDVDLAFSTQRASLGAEPPLLSDDVLSLEEKDDEEILETRDQAIETVDRGGGGHRRQAAELPGIDDGGAVQTLPAMERRDVASDGHPVRLPLFAFESEASVEWRMLPEVATTAHLRSQQRNEGAHPILAGPVELLRDSGRVGRTTVLYVAPGAPFELGWGPDPALRVHRSAHVHEAKGGMLSSWNEKTHKVVLRLSNLGAEKRDFVLRERIPISEVESVRVKLLEDQCTKDHDGPDDDGMIEWKLQLPGRGRKTLLLGYRMEIRKNVEGI